MIKPFKIDIPDKELQNIYTKVKNYPWQSMPNVDHWEYGTSHKYLKEICDYWVKDFNWKIHEELINSFSNFKTNVDDIDLHFIKEVGSGDNPKPLLLMHGWPGSIVEFLEIIKPLAHPEKFGGKKEDAFTVIAPSLPGFGFSSSPNKPIGPRKIAKILNKLMTENLKYKNYVAQGGDWGATIANWLGYDHYKSCKAIHINCLTMRLPINPQTEEEKKWLIKFDQDQTIQDGYRTQQATKPQTLSYAMMDSPVGIAAWIIEKMHGWSDLKDENIETVYSKDTLIKNIMIYVLTNTFNSASWIYFGRRKEGGRYFPNNFKKIDTPTGIAVFPKEMSEWPPKSYVERIFNIQHWKKMNSGGHFAALEKPRLLIEDIREFFSKIKI
jgi:pimeloyl-ACP methyl ester carboxylesterase